MELKKTKPIHLRCPKCGYDFSYNTNNVEEKIDTLKCEISEIKQQVTDINSRGRLTKEQFAWKKKAVASMNYKIAELQKLKKARKAIAQEIKLEEYEQLKKIIKQRYGKEVLIEIIREIEDNMVYREYDMAKQSFTNFQGV